MLIALQILLTVLTVCGLVFCLIALWSARAYQRAVFYQNSTGRHVPVSVLKPVKGADEGTYAALRSHFVQRYGTYQVLFGVNDEKDAAIPVLRRLMAEFPNIDARLLVCSEVFGFNRKVSNLMHLLRAAKYEYVLVNDDDIEVSPEYLSKITPFFENSGIGMVTCLYRGRAAGTLGSQLEALGISTDFAPGVLTARYLEGGLKFALGSTMAISRSALDAIGGFGAVVDYLADDYQLGERIAAAGFKVELAPMIVQTSVPAYSFREFWNHQLRWARTMRVSRPQGFRGLALTHPLPWAILLTAFAFHHWWSWVLLLLALAVRVAVAIGVGERVLGDTQVRSRLWLLPIRDFLAVAIWIWSYAANHVTWREQNFVLQNGKMRPAGAASTAAPVDISH
jgi:ceramide glucosyltransferase